LAEQNIRVNTCTLRRGHPDDPTKPSQKNMVDNPEGNSALENRSP